MRSPRARPVRGVRRPVQDRSRLTVQSILDAGARILAERGWAAFDTNAVAARAGVSIGSLYEYFEDKHSLTDAIADAHLAAGEALLAAAGARLAEDAEPQALVAALVEGAVALHADDPRLHRVLSSEVPLSARVRGRAQRLRDALIERLAHSLRSRVPDPRLAATLLVDTADATVHRWWVEEGGAPVRPRRLASELGTMLTAYLLAVRLAP